MVIDFYCAEKTMCEYSGKMEAFAAKMLLIRLHKKRINLRVCTTDRSGQLKTLLKEVNQGRERRNLPLIKHCFDTWHYVKSVSKDLFKASKLKKCAVLSCWIRSIRNMLWYSFSSCGGSADLLREMILSIPHHVAGIHTFPENKLFKQCLHGDLASDRGKPWLKESSLSMKKIVLAIRGHKDCRLRDLQYMTEFQHTSVNEQLNNLHNVYLPKHTSFGHLQAMVRGCLTAIDHNYNVNRSAAKDRDGEDQYNIASSRDGQIYTAKLVKEPKNTKWRQEIMQDVLHAARTGAVCKEKISTDDHLKRYGKKLPKPEKSAVVAATKARSRFKDLSKS
jgi:solute carrier family 8 (sodium/calcium exchanger)